MSLTNQQDLPNKSSEKPDGWTKRSLISLQSAAMTIAKTFNALEAILLFEVLVAGAAELIGRHLSIGWYIILGLTLLINASLRFKILREAEQKTV